MRPFADIREKRGLDLARAACRLGLNPRYLRQLELGRRPLSLPLAERMARAYGCSVDDLVRPLARL
jgi:transcriptional regulator with XRE-family HTH domain